MMLHGTALTCESFDAAAQAFEGEYHTVTPDLRAHGESTWHPQSQYRHNDCVEDIFAIREALGWEDEPMSLVGHSISGLHSIRFAAQHPELVSELVLVDVIPTFDGTVVEHLFDFVLTEFQSLEDAVEAARQLGSGEGEAEIAAALSVLMTYDEDRQVFRYKCDPEFVRTFSAMDPSEFWDDLERVQCPVLLVLGGESRLIPPEAIRLFRQNVAK
jgi:pimeloyl-ACP methyl ester carboxylesterase